MQNEDAVMNKFKIRSKSLICLAILAAFIAAPFETQIYASTTQHGYGENKSEGTVVASRIWELIFGTDTGAAKNNEAKQLYPGGEAFGVKICGGGVTVQKITNTDHNVRLCENDIIKSINGKEIESIEDVKEALSACGGNSITLRIKRGNKNIDIKAIPYMCNGEYHLGVVLKDTTRGIGTVTYYDPESNAFGGLGHGICSKDGNDIIKMTRGTVTSVILAGAVRGEVNSPGELRGVLTDRIIGTLNANTECGVFGTINASMQNESELLCAAQRDEVKTGSATIISTIKSGKKQSFDIEIYDIDRSSIGTKSFRIRVTDDTLIALTGGIVRGMSGSPIIQNGKLVGAVTHVMVANPTEGYGIFIENMLNAAQMPMQTAA
jgi:stage IV sporulation protein B